MVHATLVAAAEDIKISGDDKIFLWAVVGIAVLALILAVVFRAEVLRHSEGTEKMQEIGRAVQEGAAAYLGRQFKTLALFVVVVPFLLLLLPPDDDWSIKIWRSAFFVLGAVFSAVIGYLGMWLAVRANVRVAAAAQGEGRDPAMRIAFRTGGHVGMMTVGLGLLGAAAVVLGFQGEAPSILEGFGF